MASNPEATRPGGRGALSGGGPAHCPTENGCVGRTVWGVHCMSGREQFRELTVRERERLWGRPVWGAHCPRESGCGCERSGELTVRQRMVVGTNNLGSSLFERERLWGRTVRGAYCPRESGCGGELSGELTATPRENGKTGKGRTIWEQTVVGPNRPVINVQ